MRRGTVPLVWPRGLAQTSEYGSIVDIFAATKTVSNTQRAVENSNASLDVTVTRVPPSFGPLLGKARDMRKRAWYHALPWAGSTPLLLTETPMFPTILEGKKHETMLEDM